MRTSFPQIASAIVLTVTWGLALLWVWALHRQWWSIRAVRRALLIVPGSALGMVLLWVVLANLGVLLPVASAYLLIFILVAGIGLALLLPLSGLVLTGERIATWISRRRRVGKAGLPDGDPVGVRPGAAVPSTAPASVAASSAAASSAVSPAKPVDPGRRSFLVKAAAVVPATAIAAGGWGVLDAGEQAVMPVIPFRFPDLPPEMDGLRILHLSDIHLGPYVDLDYLERTLRNGARMNPDLVLVTGDVADDLSVLPDALRLIDQLDPRYGTYASIGNHEYYRGIRQVLTSFDRGPIPLLIDEGAAVNVGGRTLYLGGANDPAAVERRQENDPFLRRSVERAFDGAPSDAFHLLMSHRPRGFVSASQLGIPMTISGHTHGGIQFGIAGRSPLEPFMPEQYLWGHYRRGESQLYTSAGVGHWLPFRLACPREAPVYELRRA